MAQIILLIRVSTTRQEIETQRKELIELATSDGWKNEDLIFVEGVGASAIKFNKLYEKQLDELYDTLDNNDIAAVYAWEISRIRQCSHSSRTGILCGGMQYPPSAVALV